VKKTHQNKTWSSVLIQSVVSRRQVRDFELCGVRKRVQLRDSKQPERPSALRSISNNAKERPNVGLGERFYESAQLAALFDVLEFTEEDRAASWVIEPSARAATDPQVCRFVIEMQIGIHIPLMRDIMGPAFAPDQISVAYPEAHDFSLPTDQIGYRDGAG
jgi:hypothetical protein